MEIDKEDVAVTALPSRLFRYVVLVMVGSGRVDRIQSLQTEKAAGLAG